MWNTCSPGLNFPRIRNDQVYLLVYLLYFQPLRLNIWITMFLITRISSFSCWGRSVWWFMVICKKGWKGCLGCVAQGVLFISSSVLWFGFNPFVVYLHWYRGLHDRGAMNNLIKRSINLPQSKCFIWTEMNLHFLSHLVYRGRDLQWSLAVEEELMQHSIAFRSWKI